MCSLLSSDLTTDDRSKIRKGRLAGLIVGIVIAVIILAVIAFVLYKRAQKKKALGGVSHEPVCHPLSPSLYHYRDLRNLKLICQKMVGGSSTVHETNGVPLQQRNEGVAHV